MHYLHHLANCAQMKVKPLTYTQWLRIRNQIA